MLWYPQFLCESPLYGNAEAASLIRGNAGFGIDLATRGATGPIRDHQFQPGWPGGPVADPGQAPAVGGNDPQASAT